MSMEFDSSRLNTQPGGLMKKIASTFSTLSGSQARSDSVAGMAKDITKTQTDAEKADKVEAATKLSSLKKKRDSAYKELNKLKSTAIAESGRIARNQAASNTRIAEDKAKTKTAVSKARSLAKIKQNSSVGKPAPKRRRSTK